MENVFWQTLFDTEGRKAKSYKNTQPKRVLKVRVDVQHVDESQHEGGQKKDEFWMRDLGRVVSGMVGTCKVRHGTKTRSETDSER